MPKKTLFTFEVTPSLSTVPGFAVAIMAFNLSVELLPVEIMVSSCGAL